MIMKVFTVFDSVAAVYMQPFFLQTKGQAIRAFSDSVADKNHQFSKHPDDYTLFELGEYDDSDASFDMLSSPLSLGVAVEFVKPSS